jgi:hypothetical protein
MVHLNGNLQLHLTEDVVDSFSEFHFVKKWAQVSKVFLLCLVNCANFFQGYQVSADVSFEQSLTNSVASGSESSNTLTVINVEKI